MLENSEFEQAEKLFEQALELNPKTSNAYIGILMVEQKARKTSELVTKPIVLEDDILFHEALKFASPKTKPILEKYIRINRSNLEKR